MTTGSFTKLTKPVYFKLIVPVFFQVNFPLCTIAHTPRLPEHCVEYVRLLQWAKENPFGGEDVSIDGDDPAHIAWIYEKALERAAQYNITGVTHRLTQVSGKRLI